MPRQRQVASPKYANRLDLVAPAAAGTAPPPSQPVTVATGQPYGEAGSQRAAMQAIPLPDARAADQRATAPAPAAPAPPAAPGPYDGSQLQSEARAATFQPVPIGAPTARPGEPVTAGAALGAGPGPEALGVPSSSPQTTADLLSRLAYRTPEIQDLLNRANGGML